MRFNKSDILNAAMVGLTLVASVLAVPMMGSGQNHPVTSSSVPGIGQLVR